MLEEQKSLQSADVIILEADGKIDAQNGYGYLIKKRLVEDFSINAYLFSLPENADLLKEIPSKPLIISGGATEVTANVEWVVKAREFISKKISYNQRVEREKRSPIFGICFGAQLLAECYKKESVSEMEVPEIGVTKIKVDRPHPLFKGYGEFFEAYTFHFNQIKSQELTTISLDYDHVDTFIEAFEIPNSSCFGVQFHPEFNYEEFTTLLQTNRQVFEQFNLNLEETVKKIQKIPKNSLILKNFLDHFSRP